MLTTNINVADSKRWQSEKGFSLFRGQLCQATDHTAGLKVDASKQRCLSVIIVVDSHKEQAGTNGKFFNSCIRLESFQLLSSVILAVITLKEFGSGTSISAEQQS